MVSVTSQPSRQTEIGYQVYLPRLLSQSLPQGNFHQLSFSSHTLTYLCHFSSCLSPLTSHLYPSHTFHFLPHLRLLTSLQKFKIFLSIILGNLAFLWHRSHLYLNVWGPCYGQTQVFLNQHAHQTNRSIFLNERRDKAGGYIHVLLFLLPPHTPLKPQ